MQGYLDALEQNNLKIKKEYIIYSGFTQENGLQDVTKLLGIKPLPDAIFAVNDLKAIGAMIGLKRYGYKIPQHIGIVGFLNTPSSEIISPSLTTIEQTAYEIGAKSYQLLLEHIKNPDTVPQTVLMPSKLVIRESSLR